MDVPVSRQPSCRYCGCEEHIYSRCLSDIGDGACPCPPKKPLGIYD